jgi:hypothetical protein
MMRNSSSLPLPKLDGTIGTAIGIDPILGLFRIFRAQQLCATQNTLAQQLKATSTIHRAFDEL